MDKTTFLTTLKTERAHLDQKLTGLTTAQLDTSPAPGEWSLKQNLAHLTFWEQFMLNNIRRWLETGETPTWMDNDEETRTNAQILEDSQSRPAEDVLADMRRSLAEVIALVESLPENVLTDPHHVPWVNGRPLWTYIQNEAFGEHFEEHLKLGG
ncbi:MAG: hypothetical protein Fur0022_06210 [Anaerolineales bacterium]